MNESQFKYHIENNIIFIDGIYESNVTDLVFPECIEDINHFVISEKAFASNDVIKSIKFSSSVEKIMDYAFSNCGSLENVSFGRSTSIKIGKLIFEGCSNIKRVEMDIRLLKDLISMFSEENYTEDEYRKIPKNKLDNGIFYSSICAKHERISYDRDGEREYHYSYEYFGFIPNKLELISLYFTNQDSNTYFSIPILSKFKHLKKIEFLDEVHNLRFIPHGFDVTRIINFPTEIEHIDSTFFKHINAGSIHVSDKSGKVESGTFDQCTFEELFIDDDIKLETYRLWNVRINGDLKLPSNIKNLFLHDVIIGGNFELPPNIINLTIYSSQFRNIVTIPKSVEKIEFINVDCEKFVNNSSATEIELTGCRNTHLFKLNDGVKKLTLSVGNKDYSTKALIHDISSIPESVTSLVLGGFSLNYDLIKNCNLDYLYYTPRNLEELKLPRIRVGNLKICSGYQPAIELKILDLSDVVIDNKLVVGYNKELIKLISPLSAKEFECTNNPKLSLIVVPNHVEQDKVKLEINANRYTIVYPVTLKKYRYGKTTSMESFTGPTKIIFKNPFIKLDSELNWDKYTHHVYHQYNLKSVVFYGKENFENNELVPYWDSKCDYNSFSIEKGKKHNKKFIKKLSNDIEALIEYPVGEINEKETGAFSLRIKGKLKTTNNVKITVTEKQLNKVIYETISQNNELLCSGIFDFDFNNVIELGYLLLEIRIDEISSDENLPLINDVITVRF